MFLERLNYCLLFLVFAGNRISCAPLVETANIHILARPRSNLELPDPTEPLNIPDISDQDVENFLEQFGYNEQFDGNDRDGTPHNLEEVPSLSEKLQAFQEANGLTPTGELNDETKLAIKTPRCGTRISSALSMTEDVTKWASTWLTYRIVNFPGGHPAEAIQNLVRQAFDAWSDVSNLKFYQVTDESANIEIGFGDLFHTSRLGQCRFPDSSALAHAFFPTAGDIHFNTGYYFNGGRTLDEFMNTAVHEIGHSLGLDHHNSRASIMYPMAGNVFVKPQPIDVENIQKLYGARMEFTVTSQAPEFCTLPKVDAVVQDEYGAILVFAEDYYYNASVTRPTGELISSKWPGLPGNLDAALHYGNGQLYFFKGDKFWCYQGSQLLPGHPRPIGEGFKGLPKKVDGMLVDGNGHILAFKGAKYWSYNVATRKLNRGMPASVRKLNLIGGDFDAALNTDSGLMVFKGRNYHKWDHEGRTMQEYQNGWFIC